MEYSVHTCTIGLTSLLSVWRTCFDDLPSEDNVSHFEGYHCHGGTLQHYIVHEHQCASVLTISVLHVILALVLTGVLPKIK